MFVCVRGPTFPPQVGQQGHLGVGILLDNLRHENTQTGEEEEKKKRCRRVKVQKPEFIESGFEINQRDPLLPRSIISRYREIVTHYSRLYRLTASVIVIMH